MRKLKMAALALLCVVTLCLCGIFAYGMTGHDIYVGVFDKAYGNGNYGSMHLVLDETVSLDGIDSISIQYDMNSNDIYVYESEGDNLTVKEYNALELAADEVSAIRTTGSSLEVKGKKRSDHMGFRFFSVGPAGGYVEIGLPSSYVGMLILAASSGDIRSQMDIILDKDFKAETSSGDISIPNVKAANVSINCSSGNVKFETVSTNSGQSSGEIMIGTTSGDIYAEQLTGTANIGSSSGDITVKQVTGESTIQNSSGFVRSEMLTGNTQIATTSGDITIQRVDGLARVETSSGDVKINAGSGERTVRTTSGSILLEGVDSAWHVETSSGTIWIRASKGSGEIQATSGDITLELGELTGDLNINSSSGFAKINLSQDNAFDFEAKTSSGAVNTFFDDSLSFSKNGNSAQGAYGSRESNGNEKRIHIETTSGDVQVTKN